MPLPKEWTEIAALDLTRHLKARTMAGLPHIGVIGSLPANVVKTESKQERVKENTGNKGQGDSIPDEPSAIEEDEYTLAVDSDEAGFADWKFVPNKMAYQLTVKPMDSSPFRTHIRFFIRIKEGCDGDVGEQIEDRPKKYCLSKEQLFSTFRKYDLYITTFQDFSNPLVEMKIDETQTRVEEQMLKITTSENAQNITLTVEDESEPFLISEESMQYPHVQKYKITISKILTKIDGNIRINVLVKNDSPHSPRSVIPIRKVDEKTRAVETEDETLKRYELKHTNYLKKQKQSRDPLWDRYGPLFFKIENAKNNPEGNRYGYLMEFEVCEYLKSMNYPYGEPDSAKTVNCVADDSNLLPKNNGYEGYLKFQDFSVFQEEVPVMAPGSEPDKFFSRLAFTNELSLVFSQDLKFPNLYRFQENVIERVYEAIRSDKPKSTVLISARTAGGKTEAFLIPIIQYCIENIEKKGVKALVFYPTKALANDQTSRYIEILYHLNKRMKGRKITLGLLHGDISKFEPEPGTEDDWDLPLACPNCEDGVLKAFETAGLKCDKCGESIDFVSVSHRQLVYSNPPDILITNPDTLIWDLMLRPQNHSILGRPIFVCQDCGHTYAPKSVKNKCENQSCKSNNLTEILPSVPRFIVFDEVHLFKGTFGINCSYFISRIESIIKKYSAAYHDNKNPQFIRIGSTATIANPLEFAQDFFDTTDVALVPRDSDERTNFYVPGKKDEVIRRYHVYVMPYVYNTDSTIGKTLQYLQNRSMHGMPPTALEQQFTQWSQFLQTITFVNSIRESNNLISLSKRMLSADFGDDFNVDGHTTDFDKKQRSKIERAFNRQDLHAVFATQTLEVGVDFRRVDVVMVNGFPYSFNDYLQRIGRGGRNRDSLVVTICQNWKPIDHYYYSNARKYLKDPLTQIEPVPITRNNLSVVKKHAKGAVFDYIMSSKDSIDYVNDFRQLRDIKDKKDDIIKHVLQSLNLNDSTPGEIEDTVLEFLDYLTNLGINEITSSNLFNKFSDIVNPRHQLTNLRSTDREVTVEIKWAA